ncbi:hypothetical protein DFQ28_007259 [Apophysomyces sp. BC1034]|nr:hypothetical protein DFQ28_007259 [Apophysomyces sp. BC1034]
MVLMMTVFFCPLHAEFDINELEESSAASVDAEERAYLRQIQQSQANIPPRSSSLASFGTQPTPIVRTAPSPSVRPAAPRAASVVSTQSMATAPTTVSRRRMSHSTEDPSVVRPRSSASIRSGPADRISFMMSRPRVPPLPNEEFDDSVDPWAQQYRSEDCSEDSIDEQDIHSGVRTRKSLRARRQRPSVAAMSPGQHIAGRSPQPHLGSSTSSTVTATHRHLRQQQHQQQQQRRFIDQPYNTVALGPATKQALEALQSEVIALNERVDGLKQQVEMGQQRSVKTSSSAYSEEDDSEDDGSEIWEGWRWVIKAAAKHAAVNLITVFVLFLILYRSGSPIAFTILGQLSRAWHKIRMRITISSVVV